MDNHEWAAPHPDDADDLMWWVVADGQVFMEDPYETVEEAAAAMEANIAAGWFSRPAWSLKHASRRWGYDNFMGT